MSFTREASRSEEAPQTSGSLYTGEERAYEKGIETEMYEFSEHWEVEVATLVQR